MCVCDRRERYMIGVLKWVLMIRQTQLQRLGHRWKKTTIQHLMTCKDTCVCIYYKHTHSHTHAIACTMGLWHIHTHVMACAYVIDAMACTPGGQTTNQHESKTLCLDELVWMDDRRKGQGSNAGHAILHSTQWWMQSVEITVFVYACATFAVLYMPVLYLLCYICCVVCVRCKHCGEWWRCPAMA